MLKGTFEASKNLYQPTHVRRAHHGAYDAPYDIFLEKKQI